MVIDANYNIMECKCPCCGCEKSIDKFKADNCRTDILNPSFYLRCADCRSLFIIPNNFPSLNHNNYDERYIKTYNKLIKKLKNKSYRLFACWMYGLLSGFSHINLPRKSGFNKNVTLLDIGCGIGLQTKLLSRKGINIIGIDTSQQAIDFANDISDGEKFIRADINSFQSANNVDCIRLDNVIEHVDDITSFLEQMSRKLQPGGEVIIFTPNANSASLKFLKGKSVSAWPEEHKIIFTKKGLENILNKFNLKIIRYKKNTPAWWLAYNCLSLLGIGSNISANSFSLKILSLFFLPFTYVFNLLNLNEEVVIIAKKPY